MEQLVRLVHRAALCALVVVLLASAVAPTMAGPVPSSTTFTLTGYVDQPGGTTPVPAGVSVELVSAATGTTYKTVTGAGGVFSFASSGTATTLGPGYWKLVVPTVTNVSVGSCGKCAVLPANQNPSFAYYTYAQLTSPTFAVVIPGVAVYPYTATQNGTVYEGGQPIPGASVSLLDPVYSDLVLSNTTSNATGHYSLKLPLGTWLLQSSLTLGGNSYTNTSRLSIASRSPAAVDPVLYGLTVSGRINSSAGRVPTAGNATLFDPTNGYIYSSPTPKGGYYSLDTYLANFAAGSQTFDVVLSANGYATAWYPLTVSSTSPVVRNVVVPTMPAAARGVYTTALNFGSFNPATGKGTLGVTTNAVLGNDSVISSLPNASVGQLWAQLGLDFNHTLSFPAAKESLVQAYLNARGPFFLATQATTTINGTAFAPLHGAQSIGPVSSTCVGYCGLSTGGSLSYSWSQTYTLNGTVGKNSESYTISFGFQHPSSTADTYNYSVALPSGYVLSAGTSAPAHTTLVPTGPNGTWGSFVLSSTAAATAAATATFTIVSGAGVTPIVNVTASNFTFSSANVLNSSVDNYTVVLGLNENATFSAANSIYPATTNGSVFAWDFGDGHSATVSNETVNHTYRTATPTGAGAKPLNGTLTITTSGGEVNATHFYVWVLTSAPTAKIANNASANDTKRTGGGTPYLEIPWNTTLGFNATNSSAPAPNVLSIASYSLVGAKNVKKAANYTVASGGNVSSNFTVVFSPPKTIGTGPYLTSGNVNGTVIPFHGWEYNLTLTVWTGIDTKASTTLAILVEDTQKPVSAFSALTGSGKTISNGAIVEGANGTAKIQLNAASAYDPNNGTITQYLWNVTNTNNTSFHHAPLTVTKVKPYPIFYLPPEPNPYTINLTVTDGAGNVANHTMSLTVSDNATVRPIMTASNLTGPSSLQDGKSATFWINITNTGGTKSIARNISVTWYLLSSAGTGAKRYLPGVPGATAFYTYSSGSVNYSSVVFGEYTAGLAQNKTIRAQITWTPGLSGNFVLYANVTASNEYVPNYHGGSNLAALSVALHPNPTTQYLEYGGIAAALILVVVFLIWWTRRPRRGTAKPSGKAGLERGSKKSEADGKTDS